jgi:diguanylate cyclase (GGDEF)-like protein
MRALVRRSDLVGRIGGDEFAVLCPGVGDLDEVTTLADRIVTALAEPFVHDGTQLRVGASVGVTVAEPGVTDPTELLATADDALYQAKADGRGRWRIA